MYPNDKQTSNPLLLFIPIIISSNMSIASFPDIRVKFVIQREDTRFEDKALCVFCPRAYTLNQAFHQSFLQDGVADAWRVLGLWRSGEQLKMEGILYDDEMSPTHTNYDASLTSTYRTGSSRILVKVTAQEDIIDIVSSDEEEAGGEIDGIPMAQTPVSSPTATLTSSTTTNPAVDPPSALSNTGSVVSSQQIKSEGTDTTQDLNSHQANASEVSPTSTSDIQTGGNHPPKKKRKPKQKASEWDLAQMRSAKRSAELSKRYKIDERKFGQRTANGNLPNKMAAGTVEQQHESNRRLYCCHEGDTPTSVATKLNLFETDDEDPVGRLIYDNRFNHRGLKPDTGMKEGSIFVLPLQSEPHNV